MKTRVILVSDTHLCIDTYYYVATDDRMNKLIDDINDYCEKKDCSHIFFLGDYSLDHWGWRTGGSYLHEGLSNTEKFVKEYMPGLKCRNYSMIPGNHEQYSNDDFKRFTGFDRRMATVVGGYLFILLDNYGADLDPKVDSDGTYTPADMNYINEQMEKYPDLPVILCAHWFDIDNESQEFRDLVRENDRIVCLFCGHKHHARTVQLDESWGNKMLFYTGHFSYASQPAGGIKAIMWGWRRLDLMPEGIETAYFTPASFIITKDEGPYEHPEGEQEATFVPNKLYKG